MKRVQVWQYNFKANLKKLMILKSRVGVYTRSLVLWRIRETKQAKTLVEIGKELVSLRGELQPLLMKYKKDQERIDQIRKLKEKRTEVLVDIRKAGKGCSEARAGGLIYGQVEKVDKEIAELEGTMDKNLVTVGPNQIAQAVSQKIGIPVRLGTHDDEWLIGLAQRLLERVVGQDQAVEAVTGALMKSAFFGSNQNPIGSFLFVGTPGVGKTLAKALTEELFDDEKLMIRINMSEYTKERSASQLIGSAYRYPGKLTEAVKKRPHSVVLLDEVDKAHPRVLDIFCPVLDGGYLTDDDGRVNFSNTIIIMTSNIGAKYLVPGMSENSVKEAISKVMEEVNKHFDPGLLNRLNDVVVFNPVCDDQLKDVANGLAEPGEPAQALKKPKMF